MFVIGLVEGSPPPPGEMHISGDCSWSPRATLPVELSNVEWLKESVLMRECVSVAGTVSVCEVAVAVYLRPSLPRAQLPVKVWRLLLLMVHVNCWRMLYIRLSHPGVIAWVWLHDIT